MKDQINVTLTLDSETAWQTLIRLTSYRVSMEEKAKTYSSDYFNEAARKAGELEKAFLKAYDNRQFA